MNDTEGMKLLVVILVCSGIFSIFWVPFMINRLFKRIDKSANEIKDVQKKANHYSINRQINLHLLASQFGVTPYEYEYFSRALFNYYLNEIKEGRKVGSVDYPPLGFKECNIHHPKSIERVRFEFGIPQNSERAWEEDVDIEQWYLLDEGDLLNALVILKASKDQSITFGELLRISRKTPES